MPMHKSSWETAMVFRVVNVLCSALQIPNTSAPVSVSLEATQITLKIATASLIIDIADTNRDSTAAGE